jgi:protein-S-isoprenylcysteine O-methyltransferase Ste14
MKGAQLLFKSLAGMLFLLITMGLAIFLPYGSINYSSAWIYLAVFFTSSIWITAYLFLFDQALLEKRVKAGPVAEPTTRQKSIQSVASLLFLSIFILSSFDHRFRWSGVPPGLAYAGDLLCVVSFVFLFFVFKQNRFLSATIEVQDQQEVVSTGLYAIVRHPMYAGAILLLISTPLALGSFWGLIPSVTLAIVIGYRAIDEERNLSVNLAGYKDYCKKVRYRLIPFVF